MKKQFILCFTAFLLFSICKTPGETRHEAGEGNTIRIASFNIQSFGASKMAKEEVVRILTDIVGRSDITAIQEVRSAAVDPVEKLMGLLPEKYACILGGREGRSSSKEQYWVIYDRENSSPWDTKPTPIRKTCLSGILWGCTSNPGTSSILS
ncbi:MAG: hypothetical protein LBT16_12025 [Treponema sp.]|nr:hypothetical protein [Treponema sp.]